MIRVVHPGSEAINSADYLWSGTIVLRKLEFSRTWKVLVEPPNILRFCSPKSIDRLPSISYDPRRVTLAANLLQEKRCCSRNILIFVHKNPGKIVPKALSEIVTALEEFMRDANEVSEIDPITANCYALVFLEDSKKSL
jgi:hypothetical protein